jgi:hypothetical protein
LQNIERAQKEIDRLEIEATEAQSSSPSPPRKRTQDFSKKPANTSQPPNGTKSAVTEPKLHKDDAADVVQALREATLDDKADK